MEHTGGRDLIVVGTSAGGLNALTGVIAALPGDLPASVCVVQHLAPQAPGTFAPVMDRESVLPVRNAEDGMAPERGHVYVAPPGRHLLVEEGRLRLWYGPRENRVRPAVDPLFRSAASAFGPRVAGVVLSGALDDGTMGLKAIKAAGGAALVQTPEHAPSPSMPQSALDYVNVDYALPARELGATLTELAPPPDTSPSSDDAMRSSSSNASPPRAPSESENPGDGPASEEAPNPGYAARGELTGEEGRLVGMSCPECDGPLEELFPKAPRSYRCHEGHRFTAKSLLAGQDDAAERALRVALRTLDERHRMLRRMASDAREEERPRMAERYERRAEEAEGHAESIRALLHRIGEDPARESA